MIRGRAWLAVAMLILCPRAASAFLLLPQTPGARLTMNLSVLPTTPFETRGYGSQSWNSLAALALQRWNQVGVGVGQVHDYFGIRQPTVAASTCTLDGVNNVTASSTMCGLAWGDTIAVTLRRFVGSTIIEDDVIFNAGFVYDAYPGPIVTVAGVPLIDFYRVALHEFGHASGLDHPDAAGQSVTAVMSSHPSDPDSAVDDLQADDIAGVHAVAFGATLAAAVLPASRSARIGQNTTAFATVINASPFTAFGVGIQLASSIPANFTYQTTNPATNAVVGTPNTPASIPPGGAQSYVIVLNPSGAFGPTDIALTLEGRNTVAAGQLVGVNTLLLSASASATPDIVALAASQGGTVVVPSVGGTGVFAVATVNVGATGTITASTDTGGAALPVGVLICQTVPATGVCMAPPTSSVTTHISAGQTPTFGIFVTASSAVAPDPSANRIFVRFSDAGGVTRGATSVAVRTQ